MSSHTLSTINNNVEFYISPPSNFVRSLINTSASSLCHIFNVPHHDTDVGDFRISTCLCDGINDPIEIQKVGMELISLLNGANRIFYPKYQKIKIDLFTINGDKYNLNESVFPEHKLILSIGQCKPIQSVEHLFLPFIWIAKAQVDYHIYLLLKLMSLEQNWVTLYKIFETLQTLYGHNGTSEIILPCNQKNFSKTANNFSATGLESRHGYKITNHSVSPMLLPDAQSCIKSAVKEYLTRNIQQP